jgi:hypothetical protein
MEKMNGINNVILYVVELAYGDQEFHITDKTNPNHLQLRTKHALWHKENMINLAIKKLLPENWKAVAWIDSDIEFENPNWAINTLKVLNNFDIIQPFSICLDLDEHENPMSIWQSFCFKYCNGKEFKHERGLNYWHCGYAWACTRNFYEKIEGIYDKGILGSGDYILSQILLGNVASLDKSLLEFKDDITDHYKNILGSNIKIGYVPTTIKHYFHGSKVNRKYIERNEILKKIHYDPRTHIARDENGVIIPTVDLGHICLNEILQYFSQRNEDEYYSLLEKN